MGKKKWIFIAVGVVAVLAIVLAVVFSTPKAKPVSLQDFVSITEEGFDGYGYVAVEAKDSDDETVQKLVSTVKIQYQLPEEKTNGALANGDVVSITVEYDAELAKELGLSVQAASFQYTISKLEAVAQFDILSHFELVGSGYEGYGGVHVEAPESAEFKVGNITFKLLKGYGRVEWEDADGQSGTIYTRVDYAPISLLNGSVVKALVVDTPADVFLLDGVVLTGLEREYTVDCMQESVEVDFLSYYDISFTGPDGYGQIVITPKQEKVILGPYEVDLVTGAWSKDGDVWVYTEICSDEYGLLHNGQVFAVYVNFPRDVFSGMGIIFSNSRIEVTVSGLT